MTVYRICVLLGMLCVLPSTAASADDRLFTISSISVVAAHGADLSVTQRCIGERRCRELNPWLARFDNPGLFGAAKMGVGSLGLLATMKLHQTHPKWATAINFVVAGTYTAIAIRNQRVGRNAR